MQHFKERISAIEDKMKIHFLKDSDYSIMKFLTVLSEIDSRRMSILTKSRDAKAISNLFPRLVKKYAKDIREVELTANAKRNFAEGFNKTRKKLSDEVNMILDKT